MSSNRYDGSNKTKVDRKKKKKEEKKRKKIDKEERKKHKRRREKEIKIHWNQESTHHILSLKSEFQERCHHMPF